MSLPELHARIAALGGDASHPVVPLALFFEGNDDEASIGPNLAPHPGVSTFYRVLRAIANRPDVADVVVQITEVVSEDEWPFADRVYVVTTAPPTDVYRWTEQLQPDPYDEGSAVGWLEGHPPPGAPAVPPSHRVVLLFWD